MSQMRVSTSPCKHAFDCPHRWSSMTDVEIPSLKAGAATLKESWARTPRRFWTGEDWFPSEAARPQVPSIPPTDGCCCGTVYLVVTQPIVLKVFSVWPQEATKVMDWEWWWRCFVASWLAPSSAATSGPGKWQTVLLTWYVHCTCFLCHCVYGKNLLLKRKKSVVIKSVNKSRLKYAIANQLTQHTDVCFKRANMSLLSNMVGKRSL